VLEWISGDRDAIAQWDFGVANNTAYHQVYRQEQLLFSESSEQADWGNWYWATENTSNLTHQSGSDVDVRGAFEKNGKLDNTNDTNFRAIQDSFPVFGFSNDLGSITATTKLVYTLGLTQDLAVQFDGSDGVVSVPSLWKSYFATELDAVCISLDLYDSADRKSWHLPTLTTKVSRLSPAHSITKSVSTPMPLEVKTT
jgi:hypothetical protein